MKVLGILFFTFALMISTGCTKEQAKEKVCDLGKTAATLVATQVATELSCKNVDAIKADIEAKLVESKLCEKAEEQKSMMLKSVIGDAICGPVVEGLFAGALTQLPEK